MQYKDAVEQFLQRPLLIFLLLVTVGAGVYAGAFPGAFQYDDGFAIILNPHLDRADVFVDHLDHMVRPVLYATFLIDRTIYGHDPAGYHVLNVLLHIGCGVFIYWILSRATTDETRHLPLLTAMLFLVHPIETEAVTYISGRASSLMAFFYLLAFFLYVRASEANHHANLRRLFLAGATVSLLLSLGSKETAVTFPLAILLWDVLIRRQDAAAFRDEFLSRHLPFWLVVFGAAIWAWQHPRYTVLAQFSLEIRPLSDHLLSQLHAISYALVLFFCPWNQNFDHDLPLLHSPMQWPLPLAILILCALIAAAVFGARRLPLFAFGIGWFFLQLMPTSVIPRADLLSERNLYLASMGLLLAILASGDRLLRWFPAGFPQARMARVGVSGLLLTILLTLALATHQRNLLYRDEVSLWSDTVQKSPDKPRPHNNLGHAYAMQGDWDHAMEEFRHAARLDPDYALARKNLRDAYLHQVGR